MESGETLKFDLVILGGGISASFLCLDILKHDPTFKIAIIEKSTEFPQKIGESLVDMTALILEQKGIGELLQSQTKKSGIRFLFNEKMSRDKKDIAEFASPTFPGWINAYHLDRKRFDQDLLNEVERRGVKVFRPAEICSFERKVLENNVVVSHNDDLTSLHARWVVDATGRTRFLHHQLGWKDKKISLQTGSLMAHFRNIQSNEVWDTPDNPFWDTHAIALRKFSTTHLMRPFSWWWIIRLDDVTTSIGVMFDKRKIQVNDPVLDFKAMISNDPELSKMTLGAEMGPIRHLEDVPYVSETLVEPGVAMMGDSGAFLDPLFSPGLELIGQQSLWISELLLKDKQQNYFDLNAWKRYQKKFHEAYDTRLTMYQFAYGIMGSYDLFTTWAKLGNFVYLSRIVYPSVVFKSRMKKPLRFTFLERLGVQIIGKRLNRLYDKRLAQGRVSKTGNGLLTYSGVRVPKDWRFIYTPLLLLSKAVFGYVILEFRELVYLKKSVHK